MEKKTSIKQVEANKVNALKWWVKTEEGKEIVSRNAIKHWLTSFMIIDNEEKERYDSMLNVLVEELKPESLLETMVIERIALSYTKLQRVVKLDTKQVGMENLQKEIRYLEYFMPVRENLLSKYELDMYDTTDQETEKKIVEIEKKIRSIREKLVELNRTYIWFSEMDTFEKLQRYETAIENRLYKAIKEYYKIKAINNGKTIIDVNIEK